MLYSYKCENFYSIGEAIEVNFEVNQKAPKSNTYSEGDDRASLIEAIVGPNAAGKTNVIKALAFIRHLITESGNRDADALFSFVTFRHADTPTSVSVKFSVAERIFTYDFSLNREMILTETLRELSKSEQRTTRKTLFTRAWDSEKGTYLFTDKAFGLSKGATLRKNASIVSLAWGLNTDDQLAEAIVRYWRDSVVLNVWEAGNVDDHRVHGDHLTHNAIKFFYKNPELMNAAKNILKNFDVGFHDFERETLELAKREVFGIRHLYSDSSEFSIPLQYESSGTKRVVTILSYIVQVLNEKSGGIAAIDEFDAYLHPDIVEALVKLFTSPDTNPNKAQLLFRSHSHQLLSEFDKQQIILVEKDDHGQTVAWRLDEVDGIRADENYYTKYIAGAYGAKPRIGL